MNQGIIIKSMSGFYTVLMDDHKTATCRARGRFRHEKNSPCVGDHVQITLLENGEGRIDEILGRKNYLTRPNVANVDCLVLVVSEAIPVTDFYIMDRIICMCELSHIDPIIVVNKTDLSAGVEIINTYRQVGYTVYPCSAADGSGISSLKEGLNNKISVFTGNSGVGKSSILNAIDPSLCLQTGEVSDRLGRGRHTTRHTELFLLSDDMMIIDSPGFSTFDKDLESFKSDEIQYGFKEFIPYIDQCRFIGCAHIKEKSCSVREAVEKKEISQSRYNSYSRLYGEIKEKEIPWK